jgi:hypothetical protein
MRFTAASFVVVAVFLSRCSSGGDAPCGLLSLGAQCVNDTDCCSGYCDLEGTSADSAACQEKPKVAQQCVDATDFCTQNRNCCSGLCENNACFGTGAGTACLEIGSSCIQADSCCSDNCVDDGEGHTACTPQPQPDGGVTCGVAGAPCTTPGDDPGECCFGLCSTEGTCAGSTGGGGGGGGNCGGAGSFCRYGSDCCSGQCEQVTNGGACH